MPASYLVEDNSNTQPGNSGRTLVKDSVGNLYVVYRWKRAALATAQINFAKSTDGGRTWTVEEVTNDGATTYIYPCAAIDSSNNIHILYVKNPAGGGAPFPTRSALIYRRRVAGVWQAEELLYNVNSASSVQQTFIAIDSVDDVHILFAAPGAPAAFNIFNIWYMKRTAGVWGAATNYTNLTTSQYRPVIAIDSADNIHAAWYGAGWGVNTTKWQVCYALNGGGITNLTDDTTHRMNVTITVDSADNPQIVYSSDDDDKIYYMQNTGAWSVPETVLTTTNLGTTMHAIDINDNINILTIIANAVPFYANIFYISGKAGSWSPPKQLTFLSSAGEYMEDPSPAWALFPPNIQLNKEMIFTYSFCHGPSPFDLYYMHYKPAFVDGGISRKLASAGII